MGGVPKAKKSVTAIPAATSSGWAYEDGVVEYLWRTRGSKPIYGCASPGS